MNDHSYFHVFRFTRHIDVRMFLGGDIKVKRDKPKYKQIIDAAVIVIAENGYHQAQVSKIAKQAGGRWNNLFIF